MTRFKSEVIEQHRGNQASWPVGRLSPLKADYDIQTKTIQAYVPSMSEGDLVYLVSVNAATGEAICGCKGFECIYSARKNKEAYGVFIEHTGLTKWPSITRLPSSLCPHLRKMRLWLKRHGIYQHIETCIGIHEAHFIEKGRQVA